MQHPELRRELGHRGVSTQKARGSREDFESRLGTWVESRLMLGGQGLAVAGRHGDEIQGEG